MNDMERRKFEDSFQEAFKDAEVSPSDNVWTNVELDLERAEGGKMKRRLLFFKTLAAASITFAVLVGGVGYYLWNDQVQSNNLAHEVRSGDKGVVSKEASKIENEKRNSENATERDGNSEIEEASPGNEKVESAAVDKKDGTVDVSGRDFGNVTPDPDVARQGTKLSSNDILNKKDNAGRDILSSGNKSIESNIKSERAGDPSVTNNSGLIQNIENNAINIHKERSELADSYTTGAGVESFNTKAVMGNKQTVLGDPANRIYAPTSSSKLPSFYQPKNPELQLPVTKADPGALLLAKLADEERAYVLEDKKKQKDKSEKLWTSVGFAAGGFNSPNPSVSPAASVANLGVTSSNVATKQSKASGLAYSVGFSVGANLSDRWVLQGGVNYLTQSSDYTANNVIVADNNFLTLQAESINAYNDTKLASGSQSRVAQTFPYNVNNNVQFVSVPVQAGYMVLNKKLGFQVNAGISTDLFLQNTITPEGGGLTQTTQSRGDDSPYRSLNFSGLMGTELSYKLGYRYRLSLNPGLRYPLNSVYKSDTGVQATPLTFDIGLRFRYIFH